MTRPTYWQIRDAARRLAQKAGQNPDEVVSFGPPDLDRGENEGPIWFAFRAQAETLLTGGAS